LYNNLQSPQQPLEGSSAAEAGGEYKASADPVLELALQIDATVKRVRPDSFRGHQARENLIKSALLPLLGNDVAEVERIFAIIKQQAEY
jgi:type I restriction enzyme, R subunit